MKSLTASCKQTLSVMLEEKENELNSEKKNALKRDKTIQGLTQVLREKEKEVIYYLLCYCHCISSLYYAKFQAQPVCLCIADC